MICGIYKITNLINNKCYIGCSVNIYKRWRDHKYEAFNKKQEQYDYTIHKAFRKYGLSNFKFEILEVTNKEKLFEKEKKWIKYFNSYYNGYNETEGGDSGPVMKGEENPKAILNNKQVENIRKRQMNYELPVDVYKDFKELISYEEFEKIWQFKTWKHIMPEVEDFRKNKDYISYIKSEVAKKEYRNRRKEII